MPVGILRPSKADYTCYVFDLIQGVAGGSFSAYQFCVNAEK